MGLGNPGIKHQKNRHNIGFTAVDFIASRCKENIKRAKFNGLCTEVRIGSCRILLLKPQTYMNLSGNSVKKALDFYKLPTSSLIVIYDDIALPCASLRIRKNGSAGGHNGIKSIIADIGEDFCRLRIGVGEPTNDLSDYVLSDFSKGQLESIKMRFEDIYNICELFSGGELERAMNLYSK